MLLRNLTLKKNICNLKFSKMIEAKKLWLVQFLLFPCWIRLQPDYIELRVLLIKLLSFEECSFLDVFFHELHRGINFQPLMQHT